MSTSLKNEPGKPLGKAEVRRICEILETAFRLRKIAIERLQEGETPGAITWSFVESGQCTVDIASVIVGNAVEAIAENAQN